MSATKPTIVTTTPGTAATPIISQTGATGGDTSIATTGIGGVGAPVTLTGGTGGVADSANTASTGGKGGTFTYTGGNGGTATNASGTANTGGAGGDLILAGGTGGNASGGGTSNTGGAGGDVYLIGGAGGTGATANGADGDVYLAVASDGTTARGTVIVGGNVLPLTSDGAALGTSAKMFSDLFLASGAVINFNNGDVTVTHSANTLAFAGASSGYTFDAVAKPSTNDGAALGSATVSWADLFLASGGVINFNNGDVTITHSANSLAVAGGTSYTFDAMISPASSDGAALGSASVMWADLFLASGAVINFNNGDVTVTHSANALAFAGASSGYSFDAVVQPSANDAAALGAATVSWADLFLASGGVINFNNGNVTITHSAGVLTLSDAASIAVGTGTGTKIGTAASQKIGFFNATPVVQQTKAGHNNWSALSDVVSALVNLGLLDQT